MVKKLFYRINTKVNNQNAVEPRFMYERKSLMELLRKKFLHSDNTLTFHHNVILYTGMILRTPLENLISRK